MPRTTNLVLSQEQEQELLTYAFARLKTLREDNSERIRVDGESWAAYENDASHRIGKGIFKRSNVHLPLTAMAVEYFHARAEEAVVDAPPYFDFDAIGAADVNKAKVYNQYYNWKIETKGKAFATVQDAMLPFFVQRAAILKATFADDKADWMESGKNVLFDRTTNKPVDLLGVGIVIQDEDAWDNIPDAVTGEAVARLRADPTLVFDPNRHEWRPVTLRRSETLYRGPRSVHVDYDRFLCPSAAPSIDAADAVAESYDRGLDWFGRMWIERPWAKWVDAQNQYVSGDATPKTDGEQKRDSKESLSFDTKNPVRKVVEMWIRRDVLGWGKPQEFVLFLDEESQKAIYYEFQAKVCPDMKRPYTAIAIGKTKNRWWGKSMPEKVAQYQEEADKEFNSQAYRNKIRANPFKGGDKTALKDPDQDLESSPDDYIEVKQNRKLDEVFQFSVVPDLDDRTQFLVDYIIRMVQLWLGISNLAQGDYADLPENNTARGIEATLRESSKVSKRWIRRIIRSLEEHVLKLVQIAMATLPENAVETYEFSEGKNSLLGTLTAREIRSIEVNVKLRMRQMQDSNDIERADAALKVQQQYFATPLQLMPAVRPLLAEILTALGYKNVDELLPLVPGVAVEPVGAPPADPKSAEIAGAAGAMQPPEQRPEGKESAA